MFGICLQSNKIACIHRYSEKNSLKGNKQSFTQTWDRPQSKVDLLLIIIYFYIAPAVRIASAADMALATYLYFE